MMFRDRAAAGRELAKQLAGYRGSDAVVYGIARGGVAVARPVADVLRLPLDIAVVRKIGHPFDPEYAVCAIDAAGTLLCDERERASVDPVWLADEAKRQRQEAERRERTYRGERPLYDLSGKTAIIVDDGIATGLSMRLVVTALKARGAARVVAAAPVASADAMRDLSREADEVAVVLPPGAFLGAVGSHYEVFPQVSDEAVRALLAR